MPHKSLLSLMSLALFGCATTSQPPIATVAHVDLQRYAGDWYVIANIPPWIEKGAINSVEHYEIERDGDATRIPTTFTYHKKSVDTPLKTLHSTAYVSDRESNAEWGVQFIWPIKAEYLIAWLADDYSQVIVARNKRDYAWYMARSPSVSPTDLAAAKARLEKMGYELDKLNIVPQQWPDQ